MKLLLDSDALISATELVELIGADPESVSNWIRREIINRSPLGGRSTRNRLFSTEEVYKTVLKYELIKLGLPPSSASDAVNDLWKVWWAQELPEGKDICAILVPNGDKWSAVLCWQKKSGGPLYKSTKQSGFTGSVQLESPRQAFVALPLSDIFADVTKRLTALLDPQGRFRRS
jgi:hypothetical protein